MGCGSLESLTIPDGGNGPGAGAFWRRGPLKEVTIPAAVPGVPDRAGAQTLNAEFRGCPEGSDLQKPFCRNHTLGLHFAAKYDKKKPTT